MRLFFFGRSAWQDPDWRVREQAAYQLRDPQKLVFLAVQDVAEEVRVAASKSLRKDVHRAQVVRDGFCVRARSSALAAIGDRSLLLELCLDAALPPELRIAAGERANLEQAVLLRLVAEEIDEGVRLWAVERVNPGDEVNSVYATDLPRLLRLALISRVTDAALLEGIVRHDPDPEVRARALTALSDEGQLSRLYLRLEDAVLRRQIIGRVSAPALLAEMLAEEDDDTNRLALVEHLPDQPLLSQVALRDHHPQVRIAAARKLLDSATALQVITSDPDRRVRLAALGVVSNAAALASVAESSEDEQVRWQAVEKIADESQLEYLATQARHPDVQWLAGRREGRTRLEAFFEIRHDWTLRKIAESERAVPMQQMAVRRIDDRRLIEALATSSQPVLAETARQCLGIRPGPHGISFMPIPGRPYELAAFPVTCGQARAILGPDPRWEGDAELPATGILPTEAVGICAALHALDGAVYRLPSFEEWLHATVAGDSEWFLTPGHTRIEAWTLDRLHLQAAGPRPRRRAWPNPWGLLDAVGNVAIWVDEEPGPASWIAYQRDRDALSSGGPNQLPQAQDYAVAAGPHWADTRLKPGRWERLVRLDNLTGSARDKIGVRLLRVAPGGTAKKRTSYRLTLGSEARWGLPREQVIEALRTSTLHPREQLEKLFRVAPVAILVSPDYEAVRKLQAAFRRSGAEVAVVTDQGSD